MYKVLGKLGSGGFGVVHKVEYNGITYAMKKFIVGDGSREVEKLKKLQHPNIVTYVEVREIDSECILFIEYCSRGDFYKFSRTASNIYTISNVIDWSVELFSALYYLEQQQIQHRDIKPQNVLLDEDYHLKLCDFGISKHNNTRGVTGGTPRYCPPEDDDNPKGDVYSAGLVLWEMIMRETVFSGYRGSFFSHLEIVMPDCREELSDLVSSCACKDIHQRITSKEAQRISSSLKQTPYYTTHKRQPTELRHSGNCSNQCKEKKHRPIGVLSDRTPILDEITCEWMTGTAQSVPCSRCKELEKALAAKQDDNDELNRKLVEQRKYQQTMKEEIENLVKEVSKRDAEELRKQQEAEEIRKQQEAEKERKLQEALKKPVYVERFDYTGYPGGWIIIPFAIHRLYISVTKPMYLCGIEMLFSTTQTDAKLTIRITGPNNVDSSVHGQAWCNGNKSRIVNLETPLQMTPGCKYLLDLKVDKQCKLFYGFGETSRKELKNHPGYVVEFSNYEGSETTVEKGQFYGFHFAPIPC